jgi:outer membrane immunogenic protein
MVIQSKPAPSNPPMRGKVEARHRHHLADVTRNVCKLEMKIAMLPSTSSVIRQIQIGHLMRLLATLCSVGLLCGGAALAAPPPISDWSGLYVGAGLGFRSSDAAANVNSARDTTSPAVLVDRFLAADCYAGLPCVLGEQFNGTTFRFNPYLGYNWQTNARWVFGIEAEAGFGSQAVVTGGFYPATPFLKGDGTVSNSFSVKTSWDASLRGRVGYLVEPHFMVYGTAGPTWLRVESTSNCSTLTAAEGECATGNGLPGLSPSSISHTGTKLGVTAGAGIEAMLSPNWIVRGEYRYSDYGTISNVDTRSSPSGVQTVDYDVKIKTHTATLGLAYKFGESSRQAGSPWSAYGAVPSETPWTGVYVGAGIGVRASQTTASLVSAVTTRQGSPPSDDLDQCGCFLDSAMNGTSVRFNPYIGYNWQFAPNWVAGIEGDFGWADQTTTLSGARGPGSPAFSSSFGLNDSYSVATKWDASLRLRLGYVVSPSIMIYGTAGPAWMKLEETSRCDTAAQYLTTAPGFASTEIGGCAAGLRTTPVDITHSSVRAGFTVGAGGEFRLWDNWIARAEYRYSDFGTVTYSDTRSCAGGVTVTSGLNSITQNCFETDSSQRAIRVRTNSAMFGLAYKFD